MYNMYNEYNLVGNCLSANFESLLSTFRKFLLLERISQSSIRCYLSDVRHFFAWLIFFLQSNHIIPEKEILNAKTSLLLESKETAKNDSPDFVLKYVNQKVLEAYKNYLTNNNVPHKTVNRRFSSLRKLGSFCQSQGWLSLNTFDTLRNISLNQPYPEDKFHLAEFRAELWKKGSSKLTIKNYLSDIKQFLSWHTASPKKNKISITK